MKTHPRTFRNPLVLNTMLSLRLQGWPIKELAILFNCDHTSIRKACLRNNLPPEVPLMRRPLIKFRYIVFLDGERINPGKSYEEYLKDEYKRQLTNL